MSDGVARAAGVDDQRPPAGATEDQRSAQARRPRSHHDAIPGRVHAETVTGLALTISALATALVVSADQLLGAGTPQNPRVHGTPRTHTACRCGR